MTASATKVAQKTSSYIRKIEQPWATKEVLSSYNLDNILNSNQKIIQPKFWPGHHDYAISKDKYVIDCSKYRNNVNVNNTSLVEEMKNTYYNTGLVYLINTGLTKLDDMKELTHIIIPSNVKYEGGSNWRNHIETNIYDTGAPKEAWLHFHHEQTYIDESPTNLAFCCDEAVEDKGYTFVSDGIKTTDEILKTELGKKLKEKGVCFVRCLTDREYYKNTNQSEFDVYNHWQQSFGLEDPDEVSEIALKKGYKIEWEHHERWGRYLKTRYYNSCFEYFEQLDRNLMYASLADHNMWFDTWPGVCDLPPDERPLQMTYGDDSEFTDDERQEWIDIYDKYGIPIHWNVGDIAIVCNFRWAHGRPRYTLEPHETRNLGVVLGPFFKRIGARRDKW